MTASAFTFEVLDALALAVEDGVLGDGAVLPQPFIGSKVGPMLELSLLSAKGPLAAFGSRPDRGGAVHPIHGRAACWPALLG
jgi:hypothetical protein